MRFRALVTDIDGTITNRKEGISLPAIRAIRKLEKRGIPVLLASARPFPVLNILKEYIMTSGAIICENGGFVEYREESQTLGDRKTALEAFRRLKEAHGNSVMEAWTNPYNVVDLALERSIPREDVLQTLRNYPTLRLLDSGYFYHLMPIDVDKGKGLKTAARMMGIDTAEMVAVGDSQVDLELLKASGYGVAVGDSSQELKEVADMITKKPDGKGLCEAVKKLF